MVEAKPDKTIESPEPAKAGFREIASLPHAADSHLESFKTGNGVSAPTDSVERQSLQSIQQGFEAVARAQFEQVGVLDRVEKAMIQQSGTAKVLAEAKQALEQRNTVNRAMFEALHGELKTYKDAFLLEAVLRPVIRDLISLYDDICEIHRQLALALDTQEQRGGLSGSSLMFFETVAAPAKQLEHNRDAILEVLERLDVTLLPSIPGKLEKTMQRAVAIEVTDDPAQDSDIVKVTKRGFLWKERVIRAEEVVMKRLQESPPHHAGAKLRS